jgi:UDP-glucuronate decarboxylase
MIYDTVSEDIKCILSEINNIFVKEKDILVTGGAGFIGSYLCDVLVELGANVTCLDNFSTGLTENIDHLLGKSNFHLIKENVSNFDSATKYDHILHFASRPSPEEYQLNPIKTLLTNSLGSYRMLELARKCDSEILFASSSEVYGDAKVVPTPETYWGNVNPVGARSCYDEGKRFGEALVMAYFKEHQLKTHIARIHNTYGPRLRADGLYGRAVSRFISQAISGLDLTIYGDGLQTRSFCYVTDTVRGILLLLASKNSRGRIFNIGNQEEVSILELANKIRKLTESRSGIRFCPAATDDPRRRCPDIRKASRELLWSPKIKLDGGLARTIEWFKSNSFTARQT